MKELKKTIMTKLKHLLDECVSNGTIEAPYVQVIVSTFEKMDMTETTEAQFEQLFSIFEATLLQLMTTDSAQKAASMFMVRTTSAPDITMGYVNILMTLISTTIKQGNEILLYINRYNSCIANLSYDQLAVLQKLAPARMSGDAKDADIAYITQVIDSQFIIL